MRVFFIGTVDFSKKTLQKLLSMKVNIIGVITKKSSNFHSDFADLTPLCVKADIPYRFIDDINSQDSVNWIRSLEPDFIFCFGWSSLLKPELIAIPRKGIIGYHPTFLPQNRGRHPLIWALVLGLEKGAATFFFINERADSGDIISQEYFNIDYSDNAATLKEKVHNIALKQIEELIPRLENDTYQRIPQDHTKANIWRRRIEKDGEIDFRMSSRAIYNLVGALTRPYVGAHLVYKGKKIKVWEAREVEVNLPNIEYGKVLDVRNNEILIRCFDNAILLTKHDFKEFPEVGGYIL